MSVGAQVVKIRPDARPLKVVVGANRENSASVSVAQQRLFENSASIQALYQVQATDDSTCWESASVQKPVSTRFRCPVGGENMCPIHIESFILVPVPVLIPT